MDFSNKLKTQRVQTLERLRAEKEAELEKVRQKELDDAATLVKSVTAEDKEKNKFSEEELMQEAAAIEMAAQVAAMKEAGGPPRLDASDEA